MQSYSPANMQELYQHNKPVAWRLEAASEKKQNKLLYHRQRQQKSY